MGQAFITVIVGVLVFIIGQILVRFFVEPAHEQLKTIGKTFFSLTYYANIYTSPGSGTPEVLDKAADAIRANASELKGTTHAIRLYRLWEGMGLLPIKNNVEEAIGLLFIISNQIYLPYGVKTDELGHGRSNKEDSNKIMNLLKERKHIFKKGKIESK